MPALPSRRRVKIWARAIEPDCYEGSILNSLIICLDNGVHFTDSVYTNSFGERFFTHINHSAFYRLSAQAVYDEKFGQSLLSQTH